MADKYKDDMNISYINGFGIQEVAYNVWAIDEFGIAIMYLIKGTKKALLLDTGTGLGNVRSVVETLTDLPYVVVNSHHHYDHTGGNFHFDSVYAYKGAEVIIKQQNTADYRKQFILSQKLRPEYNYQASIDYDINNMGSYKINEIDEKTVFDLGDRQLEVIYTPGHTKDSICLLDRKNRQLFSADTVVSTPILIFHAFSADLSTFIGSLNKIKSLQNNYELIFPGHYIRPIGELYVDQLIICAKEILSNPDYHDGEKNDFAGAEVYYHQYERATIAYTKDLVM